MKILIFNWRDIRNPASGGAEILTHEICRRWVSLGHQVTLFSSFFPGSLDKEMIDGVTVVRGGTANIMSLGIPVHVRACLWYLKNRSLNFDIVIDEIHGIPFFTPLYVKEKKVALICEVADEIWDAVFIFPFNIIGKVIERVYFQLYKKIPFLTISRSTAEDLVKMGVEKDDITVLPMGVNGPAKIKRLKKESVPTLLYVGRLSKSKGIEDAITALSILSAQIPNLTLWIVGRGEGEHVSFLQKLIIRQKLNNRVKFFGYVSEEKKFELMKRAHLLLVPSVKEGWGLIVTEAGLCQTPSIVYDVGGLREVVENDKNGIVINPDSRSMAIAIKKTFDNPAFYKKLQKGAKEKALKFTWDDTARIAFSVLKSL